MKTYLDLVNLSIMEAKVTLDPLTSSNFNSPPRTALYNHFKTWVNRAYRELMLRRKEWQFRMERANLSIWPRLHLTDVTTVPTIGDVIQGAQSGSTATVVKIHSVEDVENDSVTEVTLSLDLADGVRIYDFWLTEQIDILSVIPASNIGSVKGIGSYPLTDEIATLEDVDIHSIKFYDPAYLGSGGTYTAEVVGWDHWLGHDYGYNRTTGRPNIVTVTPDGSLQFFPHLDKNYLISFNYTRTLPELVQWDDQPTQIPERFEDYILWKAIADYADFDSNQRVYARANKNLETYIYWLERDELEAPRVGPNRFYRW